MVPQGVRARKNMPPPIATNLRFSFEIDNRKRDPLKVLDWELFVVESSGAAMSWDALPVQPTDWDGTVPARTKLVVELVDGMFPPRLRETKGLRIALRIRTAARSIWIGTAAFDVSSVAVDRNQPPPP
jgi:hypothetical protein